MLVGIMGGTFDPIHTGHLIAAERARVEAGLDEVWLMPANVPPHKPNAPKATTEQRWEMVCLAAEGNPFFRPMDIEISKGGVSYSIDTIELLARNIQVSRIRLYYRCRYGSIFAAVASH